jgi:tryptophan synthase alpha chain
MTSLETALRNVRQDDGCALVPYITAGDPDLDATEEIIVALAETGAAAIEVGVPFSDPIADGPVIQRACDRALKAGTTIASVLDMCERVAKRTNVPLVLFSYLNPLLAYGMERLAARARACGISGVLITDLPFEASHSVRSLLRRVDVDLISLIAPTTSPHRIQQICSLSTGFLYLISRTGITGSQAAALDSAAEMVSYIRRFTDLPVAIGFGIAAASDAAAVSRIADAAVIGSALVRVIEQSPTPELITNVQRFIAPFVGELTCLDSREQLHV